MGEDISNSRHVTISCANHHELLVKGLWNFLLTQHGLDVEFPWGGEAVRGHRLILEIFLSPEKLSQTALAQDERSSQGNVSTINSLLEFLYKGTVTVPEEQLEYLLDVARDSNFKMLVGAVKSATKYATAHEAASGSRHEVAAAAAAIVPAKTTKRQVATSDDENQEDGDGDDEWLPPSKKSLKKLPKKVSVTVDPSQSVAPAGGTTAQRRQILVKKMAAKSKKAVRGGRRAKLVLKKKASKTPIALLNCEHCPFRTPFQNAFAIHQAVHDPNVQILDCERCHQKFTSPHDLASHEAWHDGDHCTFICSHCPRKFRSENALKLHQSTYDPSIEVFKCDNCLKRFLTLASYERHCAKHVTHQCFICQFTTPKQRIFDFHLFYTHGVNRNGEKKERLHCSQCNYTCKMRQQLKNHTISHHSGGLRPHHCDQCNFTSARRGDLRHHINVIHKDIKPHLCDLCGYRTVTKSKLAHHKAFHSDAKPYQCDRCPQAFRDPSTLRRHIDVKHDNPGHKPHACHLCNHRSNRVGNLKIHLRNVHKWMEPPLSQTQNAVSSLLTS